MFAFYDQFNKTIISKHRTIGAAAKAKTKFLRKFDRNNTGGVDLPTTLMLVDAAGAVSPASKADLESFYTLYEA